jgi:transposase
LLGKTVLFTDHGQDWSDEQIVLGYRAQHHVDGDFRLMKNPLYLSFRPTFHWTDQKLRVHAFYCVLALMILNLLRRQLAQAGIPVSVLATMKQLTNIQEVTVLYPAPQRGQKLPRANHAVEDEPQTAKNGCRPRPRSLSGQLGHTS